MYLIVSYCFDFIRLIGCLGLHSTYEYEKIYWLLKEAEFTEIRVDGYFCVEYGQGI